MRRFNVTTGNIYLNFRVKMINAWVSELIKAKGVCEAKKPELCELPEIADISHFQCAHQEKGCFVFFDFVQNFPLDYARGWKNQVRTINFAVVSCNYTSYLMSFLVSLAYIIRTIHIRSKQPSKEWRSEFICRRNGKTKHSVSTSLWFKR